MQPHSKVVDCHIYTGHVPGTNANNPTFQLLQSRRGQPLSPLHRLRNTCCRCFYLNLKPDLHGLGALSQTLKPQQEVPGKRPLSSPQARYTLSRSRMRRHLTRTNLSHIVRCVSNLAPDPHGHNDPKMEAGLTRNVASKSSGSRDSSEPPSARTSSEKIWIKRPR